MATESDPDVLEVNVRTLDQPPVPFSVPKDLLVSDLKMLIEDQLVTPADRQRLIFRGQVLQDERRISDYVQQNGLTINMVARPPASAQGPGTPSLGTSAIPGGFVHFYVRGLRTRADSESMYYSLKHMLPSLVW